MALAHGGRGVVQCAFVRKAFLVLQTDLDWYLLEVLRGEAKPPHACLYTQHVLLADIEVHVDRIGRHNSRELCWAVDADQFSHGDLPRGHDAVEWSFDLRITEIDAGLCRIHLRLLELGARGVAVSERIVEGGFRSHLPARQFDLPFVFRLRLRKRRLRAGFGRLRLIELELVRLGLDHEQRGTLLYLVAVVIFDLLQKTLHARDEIDGIDRRRIAGRVEITRDLLLHGQRDADLRGRGRDVVIVLSASRQDARAAAEHGQNRVSPACPLVLAKARTQHFRLRLQILACAGMSGIHWQARSTKRETRIGCSGRVGK